MCITFQSRVHPTSCAARAKSPFWHAQVLVEHFIASGIDGFYVAGSTGEGFTMTVDERTALTAEVTNLRPKPRVLNIATNWELYPTYAAFTRARSQDYIHAYTATNRHVLIFLLETV